MGIIMVSGSGWPRQEGVFVAQNWQALHEAAHAAGMAALEQVVIEPSIVGSAIGLSSVIDKSKPIYIDRDCGPCGFAWVKVPGNCGFGRWAKQAQVGSRDSYAGGVNIRVRAGGQSYAKKMAYAGAYAAVLREAGVPKVYPEGRLD